MEPHELPVYRERERILEAVREHQAVIIESPTGSGKTTQIPIILRESGLIATGVVGVTQPRRIAAVSVCDFIARQLGVQVPDVVGYKMRFEDRTSPATQIKIMTDGILLQEVKADPDLRSYAAIVVDEAHERSLNIDFVLGLLKQILIRRPEFRAIISSATINAEVFSEYFDECPIVRIDAPSYPVQLHYQPPPEGSGIEGVLDSIVSIVGMQVDGEEEGDILIFLQGEQAIKDCVTRLLSSPFKRKLLMIPLYGRLGKEEQERVFVPTPEGKIKVVVATNIAETSVTIDGITAVIDSGFVKLNFYNHKTFTSSLIEVAASRASCNQRKGRAGRTRPGRCFRLYSSAEYETRPLFTTEEIYRTDLSEVVLRMAELGIRDFHEFDFLSPPSHRGIESAVDTLNMLDALEEDNSLTSVGVMMARFPLQPQHARIIVEAIHRYPDTLEETIIATAFLSTNSPFILPPGEEMEARRAHHRFRHPYGDFISYLLILRAYLKSKNKSDFSRRNYFDDRSMAEIANVRLQLEEIVSEMGVPLLSGGDIKNYLSAISRGLIQFVCARSGRAVYRSLKAERIYIHPGSVMFRENPDFIVAGEIVKTTRLFARSVSPLQAGWLAGVSPLLKDKFIAGQNRGKSSRTREEPINTTWSLKLGGESFQLEPYRGKKKIAILPWEKIHSIVQRLGPDIAIHSQGIRGKVLYGRYQFLVGVKLPAILALLPRLDPEGDLAEPPPTTNRYTIEDLSELCIDLKYILRLCPLKSGGKSLGFTTLQAADSAFWFKSSKRYNRALTESLASLEELVDIIGEGLPPQLLEQVNKTYRNLASLLER